MGERIVSVAAGERDLVRKLEAGAVLHVPDFGFTLSPAEQALLNPALSDPKRKNISLEPNNGALHGVLGGDETQAAVRALISRYQQAAADLLARVLPEYQGKTRAAPTSLRLVRVEDRKTSWRKDDSRLHVDAFPSRPTYGERILRVFCNVNPAGEPRVWRVGEPFEDMAKKMLPRVPAQWPGSAALLAALKITKRKRSGYDHIMLHLHDAMKADLEYQRSCPQETVPFAPGGAWICFSDHASHAVMSGQFMLEQTLWLPLDKMDDPAKSPLRQLERIVGRALA
ncbi:Kdo hydroxylase family protein [Chromobacterium subtsugae]|uniref:Kdo hydroxylase family protein n=2 Tax=Chromobacterium subtsugae TaxID=251747 RepID=UPI000640D74E|nr:Kdo hydroxylase family protein [Chromobacterium subtsugae]